MVLKYTKEGKGRIRGAKDYKRREVGEQVRVQNYQKKGHMGAAEGRGGGAQDVWKEEKGR